MIENIIIGVLSVALMLSIYVINNLSSKLNVYETWIDFFRDEVDRVYSRLKSVDQRNLFDKDDDVGFVFSEILRIADEFDKKIK